MGVCPESFRRNRGMDGLCDYGMEFTGILFSCMDIREPNASCLGPSQMVSERV